MAKQPHYGTTAKVFHWLVVALLIVQYPLGKFMPHVHRGMTPGEAMTLHISFGITILALMVLRLFWRISHPVAPARSLPAWQQLISEAVHRLIYALVLATTMTGWIFASERGWSVSLFSAVPLPMLPTEGSLLANAIGKWHSTMEWALLLVICAHVIAENIRTECDAVAGIADGGQHRRICFIAAPQDRNGVPAMSGLPVTRWAMAERAAMFGGTGGHASGPVAHPRSCSSFAKCKARRVTRLMPKTK